MLRPLTVNTGPLYGAGPPPPGFLGPHFPAFRFFFVHFFLCFFFFASASSSRARPAMPATPPASPERRLRRDGARAVVLSLRARASSFVGSIDVLPILECLRTHRRSWVSFCAG